MTILGPLTFSLREMIAAVSLWETISPDTDIEVFEDGAGNPLILRLETNEINSTLVTATLNIDASSLSDQIDQQSYLEQSVSSLPANRKRRKSPEAVDSRPAKKSNTPKRPYVPLSVSPVKIDPTALQNKTANYLLFGHDSDSDSSSDDSETYLGANRRNLEGTGLFTESTVEETQTQSQRQILCYDSD